MLFRLGEQKKPHISGRRNSCLAGLIIPVLALVILILIAIVGVLAATFQQWLK